MLRHYKIESANKQKSDARYPKMSRQLGLLSNLFAVVNIRQNHRGRKHSLLQNFLFNQYFSQIKMMDKILLLPSTALLQNTSKLPLTIR